MTSRYNDCGGGASWQVIDRGFGELHAITISPVDSQIIYLGGLNGVFKSVDGGASWMQLLRASIRQLKSAILSSIPCGRMWFMWAQPI